MFYFIHESSQLTFDVDAASYYVRMLEDCTHDSEGTLRIDETLEALRCNYGVIREESGPTEILAEIKDIGLWLKTLAGDFVTLRQTY